MTALSEYQRLECSGLWRESAGAQRRDVVVALGDATLTIAETRSGRPVTHWSLPAICRLNPGVRPALFAPGPDAAEELELTDELMIAAIGKVHRLIAARRPHPGRLRRAMMGTMLALVVALLVLVLPRVMIEHTASVLPPAKRAEIGAVILADMNRTTGYPCAEPEGAAALARLDERLFGAAGGRLVVVPQALEGTRHLPGRIMVIGAPLLAADGPEPLARALLAEELRAGAADPLVPALRHAGIAATFRLLTTGALSRRALRGYGTRLLSEGPAEVPDDRLAPALQAAGLGADPAGGSDGATPSPAPVLGDNDWVALQGICAG